MRISPHKNHDNLNIMDDPKQTDVRFEVNEKPPISLTIGLGLQLAILCIAGVVLTPVIVIQAAGGTEEFLTWAVFAAVLISGATTILQAVRVGRIGAGYVLLMGTSGAFISVCITAIAKGGPAMLATLVIVSALFQFTLAARLSLFRRILTQTVAGTVIMLIPVSVMPILFDLFKDVPEGASLSAAPLSLLITVVVIAAIALKARGALRMWSPVIGVLAGSIVGGIYGLYDTSRIAEAAWIGIPTIGWPGLDLSFGPLFWTLLPAFVFVTFVGAIETIGDSVAIQRVSWRRQKAVDFRAVQGAVAADGLGNLLAGLIGTMPNTTYSSSISVTELTGVASRRVGVAIGVTFLVLAFLPKALASISAIPSPVAGGYLMVLLAMLFVVGMKIIVRDGVDYRKGLIAGISFWVGVGFQSEAIFPEIFADFAGGLMQNGMTSGGLTAIILSAFVEFTRRRPIRIETTLDPASLPELRVFVAKLVKRGSWGEAMVTRLETAVEETMLSLIEQKADSQSRRMLLSAHEDGSEAVLEFIASTGDANLQDQSALLTEATTEANLEQEISQRMLRHISSSVHHQSYHDTDIVTVHVKAP